MAGCEGYTALARVYDLLNREIDYAAWADFYETCFDRFLPTRPSLVLDLACGTGRLTRILSSRGYDMIGVDGSEDMLSEAYMQSVEGDSILYLAQDMRSFELYGTVGAVVSSLDSVNYLLSPEDLLTCFRTVHNYLDPDGLFLFDVNSPYKFEKIYGDNAYILENEFPAEPALSLPAAAVFCGWQNQYDRETRLCDFFLTIFEEQEDGSYRREEEHQTERCYTPEELIGALMAAGFECLGCFGGPDLSPVTPTTERLFYVARAKK